MLYSFLLIVYILFYYRLNEIWINYYLDSNLKSDLFNLKEKKINALINIYFMKVYIFI